MLPDFFRINLPYGLARNKKGEWMAFNREYMPLGFSDSKYKRDGLPNESYEEYPVYAKYKGLTERLLTILAENAGEYSMRYDEKGDINMIFLYNGTTNPIKQVDKSGYHWQNYWSKLTMLSKLQIK